VSDNSPQCASKELETFAKTWDFEPAASGKAESGVKMTKRLLRKSIKDGTGPYLPFRY